MIRLAAKLSSRDMARSLLCLTNSHQTSCYLLLEVRPSSGYQTHLICSRIIIIILRLKACTSRHCLGSARMWFWFALSNSGIFEILLAGGKNLSFCVDFFCDRISLCILGGESICRAIATDSGAAMLAGMVGVQARKSTKAALSLAPTKLRHCILFWSMKSTLYVSKQSMKHIERSYNPSENGIA